MTTPLILLPVSPITAAVMQSASNARKGLQAPISPSGNKRARGSNDARAADNQPSKRQRPEDSSTSASQQPQRVPPQVITAAPRIKGNKPVGPKPRRAKWEKVTVCSVDVAATDARDNNHTLFTGQLQSLLAQAFPLGHIRYLTNIDMTDCSLMKVSVDSTTQGNAPYNPDEDPHQDSGVEFADEGYLDNSNKEDANRTQRGNKTDFVQPPPCSPGDACTHEEYLQIRDANKGIDDQDRRRENTPSTQPGEHPDDGHTREVYLGGGDGATEEEEPRGENNTSVQPAYIPSQSSSADQAEASAPDSASTEYLDFETPSSSSGFSIPWRSRPSKSLDAPTSSSELEDPVQIGRGGKLQFIGTTSSDYPTDSDSDAEDDETDYDSDQTVLTEVYLPVSKMTSSTSKREMETTAVKKGVTQLQVGFETGRRRQEEE
ncbi:hypothetical protein QBC44DRAFT_305498 [Cladorrhinum sp. PSN332]|nr:hypothetical protein QBC44DRAFT_305498 [Cladorrhinum sp. PSN332]